MTAMVEFNKYRAHGAYHWEHLKTHPEYGLRVMHCCATAKATDVVLDLGCGDGAYMYEMSNYCQHVVGVDGDQDGVNCARQELDQHGVTNYTLVHSVFSDMHSRMPEEYKKFDLIYSMDCIEHLLEPTELLSVIDHYLKPDGQFIIGTPLFVTEELVSKYHVKEYTRKELHRMIKPKFELVRERWLPARHPKDPSKLKPRFYLMVCRRRPELTEKKSSILDAWKKPLRAIRSSLRPSEKS